MTVNNEKNNPREAVMIKKGIISWSFTKVKGSFNYWALGDDTSQRNSQALICCSYAGWRSRTRQKNHFQQTSTLYYCISAKSWPNNLHVDGKAALYLEWMYEQQTDMNLTLRNNQFIFTSTITFFVMMKEQSKNRWHLNS